MWKQLSCCCPPGRPSRETAHFFLLFALISIYMLAGAAMFSSLERPAELQAHQLWERKVRDFRHEHNISYEDLKSLLLHYEVARKAGIRIEQGRPMWDIKGAFYFVGTVISTIGFGVTVPSTVAGKMLLIFYGLLGISATLLFLNLFFERVLTFLSLLLFWCRRRRTGQSIMEDNEANREEDWKPSLYQLILIFFVAVILVTCGATSLYSTMEGWTYHESFYFCFVTFSTVGFGDFVSGQGAHHEDSWLYNIANSLLMILGVCWTYSLFNVISVIIKQGLNWMLRALDWMLGSVFRSRLTNRPLFKHSSRYLDPRLCLFEHKTLPQLQTVQCLCHSKVLHSCVPSDIGKGLCEEFHVKCKMTEESLQYRHKLCLHV